MLQAGLGAGIGLGLTPAVARGQEDAAATRPREGDLLVRAGDAEKRPLTPADLHAGARPMLAWAMDSTDGTVRSGTRLNQLLVVRLASDGLTAETRARAVDGIVAYTAICTHEGCEVDDWLAAEQVLHCACHGSKYDPKDGARVIEGEAPRPLPALPLTLTDGKIAVAGPFTARVGFQSA